MLILDMMADSVGSTRLSEFYDFSELDRLDIGDDDEVSPEPSEPTSAKALPAGDWFNAGLGLIALQSVRLKLEEHIESMVAPRDSRTKRRVQKLEKQLRDNGRPYNVSDAARMMGELRDELQAAERVVSLAAEHGQRFRLTILP